MGEIDKQLLCAEMMIEKGYPEEFIKVLGECLHATRQFFSPATKEFVESPDYPTMLKACAIGMPYVFGNPPERQEIVQVLASFNAAGATGGPEVPGQMLGLASQLAERVGCELVPKAGKGGALKMSTAAKAAAVEPVQAVEPGKVSPPVAGLAPGLEIE